MTSNARYREHLKAFANSCKHYKIKWTLLQYLGDTFGNFRPLLLTTSAWSLFKLAITSNARYREHLKAFANSCEHYKN